MIHENKYSRLFFKSVNYTFKICSSYRFVSEMIEQLFSTISCPDFVRQASATKVCYINCMLKYPVSCIRKAAWKILNIFLEYIVYIYC